MRPTHNKSYIRFPKSATPQRAHNGSRTRRSKLNLLRIRPIYDFRVIIVFFFFVYSRYLSRVNARIMASFRLDTCPPNIGR